MSRWFVGLVVLLTFGFGAPVPNEALVATGVYVTDATNVAGLMAQAVADAVGRVDLAMYSFSRQDLADALVAAKVRGVLVRVVADYGESRTTYSKVPALRAAAIEVHTLRGQSGGSGIMHHKFLLVDATRGVTGSFNWSNVAQTGNHENVLIFASPTWIAQYRQAFEALWALSSVN